MNICYKKYLTLNLKFIIINDSFPNINRNMGMHGHLVGSADFKSVASRQQSGWVGSIPTHSRFLFIVVMGP